MFWVPARKQLADPNRHTFNFKHWLGKTYGLAFSRLQASSHVLRCFRNVQGLVFLAGKQF